MLPLMLALPALGDVVLVSEGSVAALVAFGARLELTVLAPRAGGVSGALDVVGGGFDGGWAGCGEVDVDGGGGTGGGAAVVSVAGDARGQKVHERHLHLSQWNLAYLAEQNGKHLAVAESPLKVEMHAAPSSRPVPGALTLGPVAAAGLATAGAPAAGDSEEGAATSASGVATGVELNALPVGVALAARVVADAAAVPLAFADAEAEAFATAVAAEIAATFAAASPLSEPSSLLHPEHTTPAASLVTSDVSGSTNVVCGASSYGTSAGVRPSPPP